MLESEEHPAATNTFVCYAAQLLLVYPLTLIAGIPSFLLLSKLASTVILGTASALPDSLP